MNNTTNIQQVYEILAEADWSFARICGHFQGLLGAIEQRPECAKDIIENSVSLARKLSKE